MSYYAQKEAGIALLLDYAINKSQFTKRNIFPNKANGI